MIGYLTNELATLVAAPITFFMIILEMLYSRVHHKSFYKTRDTLENIFLGICNLIIDIFSKVSGFLWLGLLYGCTLRISFLQENLWIYWISLVLLQDLTYWLMHFTDHKVRLLWAGHIHHHSSREFNFSVGIRSAVFEPIEKFLFFSPLAIAGYKPVDIVLVYILTQFWGTFLHTRHIKKLGILEVVFTTPSHHRVHHGRNPKYIDKNFGMFLIVWDKLFKTFEAEDHNEPVEFGIVSDTPRKNYFDLVFSEFCKILKDARQKITIKQRLLYIFGPPGYRHNEDGD